jgi:nitrogen PTS system EIIA component
VSWTAASGGAVLQSALALDDLRGADAATLLAEIATQLAERISEGSALALGRALAEREALGSTALGNGIAIPHCRMKGLEEPLLALAVHPQGVDFGAADGQPVRVFAVLLTPDAQPSAHLRLLAEVARRLRDERRVRALLAATSPESRLAEFLREEG